MHTGGQPYCKIHLVALDARCCPLLIRVWPGDSEAAMVHQIMLGEKFQSSSSLSLQCRAHGEDTFANLLLPERKSLGASGMSVISGDAVNAVACDGSARLIMLDWLEREGLIPDFAALKPCGFQPTVLDGSGFKTQQQIPCLWHWPSPHLDR